MLLAKVAVNVKTKLPFAYVFLLFFFNLFISVLSSTVPERLESIMCQEM